MAYPHVHEVHILVPWHESHGVVPSGQDSDAVAVSDVRGEHGVVVEVLPLRSRQQHRVVLGVVPGQNLRPTARWLCHRIAWTTTTIPARAAATGPNTKKDEKKKEKKKQMSGTWHRRDGDKQEGGRKTRKQQPGQGKRETIET